MKTVISLIIFSIKENFKTKIYLILTIFTVVLIFIGFLLIGLSGFEQPQRVLVDTGIAMIELFCLLLILLNSVSLLLQDIETKSVYLILTKPVSRSKYIVSKFLGLLCVTVINVIIMSVIHIIFLKISRWTIIPGYFLSLASIILKTGIVCAISLLLVVVMTSQPAAVITTFLLWITGHFLSEIKFIVDRINIVWLRITAEIIYYFIPNFQYFDLKNYFDTQHFISQVNIPVALFYWLVYVSITIFFTTYVFKKKNL